MWIKKDLKKNKTAKIAESQEDKNNLRLIGLK